MSLLGDYNKIISDRNLFNHIVYTPLSDALLLLEERKKNPELTKKIKKLLKNKIPKICKKQKCAIMARQLATPNYDSKLFISVARENNLSPVFLEYFSDKFTSNNKYKHSLGQLCIQNSIDKNGEECIEKITIIDFNKSNSKKLKDVKTLWGQSLVDFHRKLFKTEDFHGLYFLEEEHDWYKKKKDETPFEFYVNFFLLVSCFGILFENFLISKNEDESQFTKEVILPAFEKVVRLTGIKPLIVPLSPIDLENDSFWYYHSPNIKSSIKSKDTLI